MIRCAVILAAGKGTRMGALSQSTPKPMLPVHGRPMLEHIIERLGISGVDRYLIVTGYHREQIEDHFRDWPGVVFRVQDPVNGTGSAVRLARDFVQDEPFVLTFGDILCGPSAYSDAGETLSETTAA